MGQNDLVRKLIARQGQHSDRAFARRLGLSHERWRKVKNGEPPGMEFLRAVLSTYPDLWLEAAAFLSPDAGRSGPKGDSAREVPT